jgi:hypothetical protein
MFAEKTIVEYLNADGSIQTSIIEDKRGKNILVEYASEKKGTSGARGTVSDFDRSTCKIRKACADEISARVTQRLEKEWGIEVIFRFRLQLLSGCFE